MRAIAAKTRKIFPKCGPIMCSTDLPGFFHQINEVLGRLENERNQRLIVQYFYIQSFVNLKLI